MTPRQRIELRMSQRRQRLGELLAVDDLDAEQRGEMDAATTGLQGDEAELRAATVLEAADAEAAAAEHGKPDEKVELRSRCSLANFFAAAVAGRSLAGAEAELAAEINLGTGYLPLDMFRVETRAAEVEKRAISEAPGTVGINLDPIRPAIFARAVTPRLGIDMPHVASGTYATGTITSSTTAAARAKTGTAAETNAPATVAAITVGTTVPHRISARLSIALEDIAAIGTENFEAALRQNLTLAMADELDQYALNGDGSAPNPTGLLTRLNNPTDTPPATALTWGEFVGLVAAGIDGGPWAEDLGMVKLLVNAETMRLAETTFQAGSGTDTPGEMSAAAYLRQHSGAFMASSRMPDSASDIAQAIRYRPGTMGLGDVDAVRTAVCPVWSEVGIDDIYTDSANGRRHVTFHVLIGDVLIVQADAYEQIQFRVAV